MSWGPATDWIVAALVGIGIPLAVWLLWRAQRLCVGVLRLAMAKMARRGKALYAVASWFGVLFSRR